MPSLTVISEEGEVEERQIRSRNAEIIPDGQQSNFSPAVIQRIEYDHEGEMSQITTVCGETENRRESDDKPDLTMEGIVVKDQLDDLKSLKNGQNITLISDIDQGDVIVKKVTIEQNTDIFEYTPNGGESQLAFPFQLQLKRPE